MAGIHAFLISEQFRLSPHRGGAGVGLGGRGVLVGLGGAGVGGSGEGLGGIAVMVLSPLPPLLMLSLPQKLALGFNLQLAFLIQTRASLILA